MPDIQAMIVAVIACVVASACASAGGGPGAAVNADCTSDLAPHAESMNAIVDSVAFQRIAEETWSSAHGLVFATVHFDPDGDRHVTVIARSLPEAAESRLQQRIEAATPGRGPPEESFHIFVADSMGPSVRRVARFARCGPALVDRQWMERRARAEAAAVGIRRDATVRVMAFVEREGTVSQTEIREGAGDPTIDLAAARIMREAVFVPGRIEGIPIAVWVLFPVRFVPRN